MPTTNNKPSFVKSKTFIISTTLALVFFVLFLVFVTLMKSRYDFCWKVVTEYMKKNNTFDSMYEEALIWKIFLLPSNLLSKPIETGHGNLTLSAATVNTLTWYMSDWGNNLTYTILTITTLFGTVIIGFIPLSWCVAKLSEQRIAKKKNKKQNKDEQEQLSEVEGN